MSEKPKNWIQTRLGICFDFDNLDGNEYSIMDIGYSLSKNCRYNGHCTRFYSVAEHLIRCSYLVAPEYAFETLMHDASEAYMSDLPRPLKQIMPEYKEFEKKVEAAISRKFDMPWPMSPQVKEIDNRILLREMKEIMVTPPYVWDDYGVTPIDVDQWDFTTFSAFADMNETANMFMDRFYELIDLPRIRSHGNIA